MVEKKKKRFKIVPNGKLTYGSPGTNYWAFVIKTAGGYKLLGQPMSCKDYIHEAICNNIHESELFSCTGHGNGRYINMEKFQIAMFFSGMAPNFKANLYSIKKYINSLEKAAGIAHTSIIEIDSGLESCRAFVITAPKEYIESPVLHHGLVAMLRTLHYADKEITKVNVVKVLSTLHNKDYKVLSFMIKHNVYGLMLKHHKRIMKGVSLKKIYPTTVTNTSNGSNVNSFHSGYGMVAICSQKIASKAYSDKIIGILKEEKVPRYTGWD
jgi:hypothetical protein